MSELNYLEKLLDGTEVEWKALGDVTSVLRGKRLTKNLLSAEEKFPVFHGGLEPLGYYNKSNRPANTVMIINVGASAGTVGYSTVDFWSSDGCFCLEHNELLNNRFLYFALIGYQSLLKSKVRVAGIPTLDAIVVNKLLIPIPCPENPEKSLAIQSEIVRILDKFTALTAELTAELNMRKKQYNYYRDQLLSFKEGEVEWKTLGEVAQYSKTRISFELLDERNYVGVDNLLQNRAGKSLSNHVPTSGKLTEFIPNDILIGNIRPYLKKIWQADCIGGTNGDVLVIRCIDSSINTRYLYQILADDKFFEYNMQHAKGAKMPRGSKEDIMKYPIPVPPLTLQARIVEILNKFDTLTNSITEGLPREIELRQKQYEYYRDLLFSFPKPETASN
ncbi:restriction endonuclease subunit S [Escherichia coli]|uniref:restriction endonuclease subunit S n=1 Tax=Escherichia coli TaxID=562 RepID=UPI001602D01E|nr:restriction endonuclease subunit S [Escherichia coli]QNC15311.1 restriction endonuclease subunit S [Escherichia coli]